MKPRCYIVSLPLPVGAQRRESSHRAVREFQSRVAGVRQIYFACYGSAETGFMAKINVKFSGRTATPERSLARIARAVCRVLKTDPDRAQVERRGDMDSPLHSLLAKVAMHPRSKDPQQLMDAVHWCINASGYGYVDELIMMARQATDMSYCMHPTPKEAPRVG